MTLRSEGLAGAWLEGTRKLRAIGGLAVVAGHTQIIADGPRLDAVRTIADTARADGGWWLAQADDVAAWWLNRSTVEVRWSDASTDPGQGFERSGIPDLTVFISLESAIDDLWLDVVLPSSEDGLLPTIDGTSVEYVDEPWGMRVRVGSLIGGELRRVAFVTVATAP